MTTHKRLVLALQPDMLAICRLEPTAHISEDILNGNFVAITKTNEELSIICPQDNIPEEVIYTKGWRCLRIEGPFSHDTSGILASVLTPLANAHLSVFTTTTFDTGHILIKEENLNHAIQLLTQTGHVIRSENKVTVPYAIQ
ncbi:amino acid-binding protein [Dictyobacter alpinus]|uniref:Amino acid-binding protein n=1 Tax=Dictyobacter alpinus TaxID=2014873 RepID=A0A402BI41_9CHLR|nr:ACT domain-containing protein [Dictyobacter alpinus]GCE30917.1 amino acid-binding protein [Dictyobacter alpinus]